MNKTGNIFFTVLSIILMQAGCFSAFAAEPGDVVINELLADPDTVSGDANEDGVRDSSDDEFIEFVNTSGSDLEISGWTVSDSSSIRHVFPPGTVMPAGCSIVVFGGGTPVGIFGGSLVQAASTGRLGLNNSGDTVTLNDGAVDIAEQTYGSEGGDNQALTRDPDIIGLFVKHSMATGSGGALFSPGTRLDGFAFAGCDESTLIKLSSFSAYPHNKKIILEWSTESETDNAGFNIYRCFAGDDKYMRINDFLIPAEGSPTEGASYEFVDEGVKNRTRYYYKLEDLDLNGISVMHGPVDAMPRLIYERK